jgi:hypothetical protein
LPPTDPRYSRPSPETRRFQVKWVVSHAQTTGITTQRVPLPRVPFSVHLVGRGFRHHFNQQPTASRARFPDRPCLPPIPDIPVRAPKPGGSRLNGSFHTPKPPESRHSVVPFPRVPFSVPFVARGFRHHFNQQPTASRARFPDRPCLPPIPDVPIRAPKPGGSRLNGSFHTPKPPESRHSVFLFRGSPFPSIWWGGGSDTTLTSNQLLPGLAFLTDLASHRSPIFPSEPRNQEVPG